MALISNSVSLIFSNSQLKTLQSSGRELQHLFSQRRLHADPEGVVHHVVGIGQVTADTEVGPDHIRLARQVAGKQQAGADFMLIQVGQQIQPRHWAIFFHRDRKAEPRRVGVFGRLGQMQKLFAVIEAFFQEGKVVLASLDELRRLV